MPKYGSNPTNYSKFSMTKNCIEKLSKSIDKFSLVNFAISTELVDINGDDTFSMYHGTENEDTITDAS